MDNEGDDMLCLYYYVETWKLSKLLFMPAFQKRTALHMVLTQWVGYFRI